MSAPLLPQTSWVGPLASGPLSGTYTRLTEEDDDDDNDDDPPPPPPPRSLQHICVVAPAETGSNEDEPVLMTPPPKSTRSDKAAPLTERNLALHGMSQPRPKDLKRHTSRHRRSVSGEPWLFQKGRLLKLLKGADDQNVNSDSKSRSGGAGSGGASATASTMGSLAAFGERLGRLASGGLASGGLASGGMPSDLSGSRQGFCSPSSLARAKDVLQELAPHASTLKQTVQSSAASGIHSLVEKELTHALQQLGIRGREMVREEDYVPAWMRALGMRLVDNIWPEIEREMRQTLMQQLGRQLSVQRKPYKGKLLKVRC